MLILISAAEIAATRKKMGARTTNCILDFRKNVFRGVKGLLAVIYSERPFSDHSEIFYPKNLR